ncbi:MAG: hypothetical protein HGA19_11555 [Oscillochloris sp.]|nr:hypothetical protein [Oscillochloris sp.]
MTSQADLRRLGELLFIDARKLGELVSRRQRVQKETQLPDVQAIKLLHEYQIARAGAPMLPDWLWSLMQRELNDLWIQHRKRSVGGNS